MHVSVRFFGLVDYAEKRCFRVSDGNVLQYVALDVGGTNVPRGQRRRTFCCHVASILHVFVEAQHASQVSTELYDDVLLQLYQYCAVDIGKFHEQRFVTL